MSASSWFYYKKPILQFAECNYQTVTLKAPCLFVYQSECFDSSYHFSTSQWALVIYHV